MGSAVLDPFKLVTLPFYRSPAELPAPLPSVEALLDSTHILENT